jgi:lipopolysaccharide export LptBFGC system permease protein LptF
LQAASYERSLNANQRMDQYNFSLIWKFIVAIGVIAFLLLAIILTLLGRSLVSILAVETGVITACLLCLLLYGVLMYVIRHSRWL